MDGRASGSSWWPRTSSRGSFSTRRIISTARSISTGWAPSRRSRISRSGRATGSTAGRRSEATARGRRMNPAEPARTVVAHVRDLLFSSRIGETARRLGYPFRATRSVDELRAALAGAPGVLLLDLTASGLDADAVFREIDAAGRPAPVIGWTTHVLWKTTKPFHERCDRVVTRETLTEELPALLREYMETGSPAGREESG